MQMITAPKIASGIFIYIALAVKWFSLLIRAYFSLLF